MYAFAVAWPRCCRGWHDLTAHSGFEPSRHMTHSNGFEPATTTRDLSASVRGCPTQARKEHLMHEHSTFNCSCSRMHNPAAIVELGMI